MTNYRKGYLREKQVMVLLDGAGWEVTDSRGSHSPADVWAAKDGVLRLIQVKRTKTKWGSFPPSERAALSASATRAGAVAELAWWPAHGKLEWIPEKDWPPKA